MTIDKFLTTFIGIFAIVFVYWFFLMKKETLKKANGSVDIIVEGGYTPSLIEVAFGRETILNFIRKDSNSCLEEVVLPDFKVKQFLPLNEKISISLNPKQKGEFAFSCGMHMYHGKIVVK